MQPPQSDQSEFFTVLLMVIGLGGAIFALAGGALVLFWKSLEKNPGAIAEKGSEAARVNRSFFVRLAALLLIIVLLSFAIFWLGSG